jgi:response regulator of citrate/malate metabolism
MPLSLPSPCQSEISIKSIPIKSITVKVSVSDNIDNTITIHPSIRAAARSLKISDSTIRRYLKSERKTFVKGRYSFNYVS